MITSVGEFEQRLNTLNPGEVDFVLRVDELVAALSQDLAPSVYEPIFRFFEAHPEADCGAPGTLVHHVEDYYPNYVAALRQSVSRTPSYNGVLMIHRILNSQISEDERGQHLAALRSVADSASAPDSIRSLAKRFLARHT